MKITYERLFTYAYVARAWLARKDESLDNPKSKLAYAIYRVSRQVEKAQDTYRQKLEDINIDHCAVDEKGIILRDERGQYKFTKEGLKAANHARECLFQTEIEFEPYFATEIPDDLTTLEGDYFVGIVISEEALAADEERRAMMAKADAAGIQ